MSPLPTLPDGLTIGDDLIDGQHRQLIRLCNLVADYTSASIPTAIEKYHRLLKEFADLAFAHFDAEELLMAESNCPMLDEHVADHNKFRELLSVMLQAGERGELKPSDLYGFANDYLIRHMNIMDMACRDHLK